MHMRIAHNQDRYVQYEPRTSKNTIYIYTYTYYLFPKGALRRLLELWTLGNQTYGRQDELPSSERVRRRVCRMDWTAWQATSPHHPLLVIGTSLGVSNKPVVGCVVLYKVLCCREYVGLYACTISTAKTKILPWASYNIDTY